MHPGGSIHGTGDSRAQLSECGLRRVLQLGRLRLGRSSLKSSLSSPVSLLLLVLLSFDELGCGCCCVHTRVVAALVAPHSLHCIQRRPKPLPALDCKVLVLVVDGPRSKEKLVGAISLLELSGHPSTCNLHTTRSPPLRDPRWTNPCSAVLGRYHPRSL